MFSTSYRTLISVKADLKKKISHTCRFTKFVQYMMNFYIILKWELHNAKYSRNCDAILLTRYSKMMNSTSNSIEANAIKVSADYFILNLPTGLLSFCV